MRTRIAPSFENLIVPGAKIDSIASGFGFTEGPSNLAWGGEDRRTVFVTARTSVYRLPMNAAGVPIG